MWPVPARNVKRPRGERRDDRHVLRIRADDPLGDAHQEIDAAGRVHDRRCHDHGEDDQHHVDRRRRRIDAERDHQHQQADRAPQAKSDAASSARPSRWPRARRRIAGRSRVSWPFVSKDSTRNLLLLNFGPKKWLFDRDRRASISEHWQPAYRDLTLRCMACWLPDDSLNEASRLSKPRRGSPCPASSASNRP